MPLYIYEAAYTAESLAAQIREPQDRLEATRALYDAAGVTVVAAGHPLGEHDIVVVFDAPDDTAAASVALTIGAGGAARSGRTTRLLSTQEWKESLERAQGVASRYRPAR
jgi:uncharacterized protein with GYD domain